jgi:nucleotide-binding universal stress UspA family protein
MADEDAPLHTEVRRFGPTVDRELVIVTGLDGTPSSVNACRHAFVLAARQSAAVTVVYAADHPQIDLLGSGIDVEHAAQTTAFAELAEDVRALAEEHAVPTRFALVHGDAAIVLAEAADECGADMVVVGRSTHLGHRIVGAVGARLARVGHWPVLIVP